MDAFRRTFNPIASAGIEILSLRQQPTLHKSYYGNNWIISPMLLIAHVRENPRENP